MSESQTLDVPTEALWKSSDVEKYLGLSAAAIHEYVTRYWLEGIHYYDLSQRCRRFNPTMVRHWLMHRSRPHVHEKRINDLLKLQKAS